MKNTIISYISTYNLNILSSLQPYASHNGIINMDHLSQENFFVLHKEIIFNKLSTLVFFIDMKLHCNIAVLVIAITCISLICGLATQIFLSETDGSAIPEMNKDLNNKSGYNPVPLLKIKEERRRNQTNVNLQIYDTRSFWGWAMVGVLIYDTLDPQGLGLMRMYSGNRTIQWRFQDGRVWTCVVAQNRYDPNISPHPILQPVTSQIITGGVNHGFRPGMWVWPKPNQSVINANNYNVTSGHLPLTYSIGRKAVFLCAQ